MKITITDGNNMINLDVQPNEQIQNIKALIQVQTGLSSNKIGILYQGRQLNDKQRLNSHGITDGDVLYMTMIAPRPVQQPQNYNIADMIRNFTQNRQANNLGFIEKSIQQFMPSAQKTYNQLKDDHFRVSQLAASNPQVAQHILNGNVKGIAQYMRKKHNQAAKKAFQQQKKFIQLSRDPMNPQYQRMLQQRIQRENIQKNRQYAQQYIPQVFGHISMLYIKASVNKVPIQAFVDTGAQSTIMSQSLAQRCNLMRLVDKRQAGTAVGVGTCKILGRIHAAQIQIQGKFITCAFTVIQNNSVEFLLGLDMLKRFNCIVDLGKNQLNFNNGMIITKFLSDGQIQKKKNNIPSKQQLQIKIKKVTQMGFTKDEALKALQKCGYNQQIAGNLLMRNKFG